MDVGVLPACVSAPCKQCPWKSEGGSGTAGTGIRVLSGWELNPNPLEETPELLTTERSFLFFFFNSQIF